jgi:hypothetical protein
MQNNGGQTFCSFKVFILIPTPNDMLHYPKILNYLNFQQCTLHITLYGYYLQLDLLFAQFSQYSIFIYSLKMNQIFN